MSDDCPPHINVYQDDLKGEFHCDDCGESFGQNPPEASESGERLMPKRIVILDPNGVEVAARDSAHLRNGAKPPAKEAWTEQELWLEAVFASCNDLRDALKREDLKLGTYTITVKEVE